MKKKLILICSSVFVAGFCGALAYDVISKPDGVIYMDPEDKAIYAKLNKDPDTYKKNSRLIFVFKKGGK